MAQGFRLNEDWLNHPSVLAQLIAEGYVSTWPHEGLVIARHVVTRFRTLYADQTRAGHIATQREVEVDSWEQQLLGDPGSNPEAPQGDHSFSENE